MRTKFTSVNTVDRNLNISDNTYLSQSDHGQVNGSEISHQRENQFRVRPGQHNAHSVTG